MVVYYPHQDCNALIIVHLFLNLFGKCVEVRSTSDRGTFCKLTDVKIKPDFFVIGAQKAGTTWLWRMLEQHPGTSLPQSKELHYFGGVEMYARGFEWYSKFFDGLDSDKMIGEASTTYFYDRMPYWHNASDKIEFDDSLPTIPELISSTFPDARYIVVLRDPVHRAVSAYRHWMRRAEVSPFLGLKYLAIHKPKMRILEYGYYAKYLKAWLDVVPADRLRVVIFEDQIKTNWDMALVDIYRFLGLDPSFQPKMAHETIHKSWGWTRIVFNYYASKLSPNLARSKIGRALDRFDILKHHLYTPEDIEFLRAAYLPEKEQVAALTGHSLDSWDYGEKLLNR